MSFLGPHTSHVRMVHPSPRAAVYDRLITASRKLMPKIDWLGLKKKLFDWRNPTDPIFTTDPKYFYFFVCKKKKKI